MSQHSHQEKGSIPSDILDSGINLLDDSFDLLDR
jgi:hypothetical protein